MQEGSIQSCPPPSDRLERLITYIDARNSLSWQRLNPIELLTSLAMDTTVSAGHLVCHTAYSVLVYRIPSRLRGVTERTWRHEFDFPGYVITWVGVELDEDLLLLETHSTGPELRRSVVNNADFAFNDSLLIVIGLCDFSPLKPELLIHLLQVLLQVLNPLQSDSQLA
jgi:hypothetical protein